MRVAAVLLLVALGNLAFLRPSSANIPADTRDLGKVLDVIRPVPTPPSEGEVLRALANVPVGDLRIVYQIIAQRTSAPRFYPLVGLGQLVQVRWKCTVYGEEGVAVVYIGKDRLELVRNRDR